MMAHKMRTSTVTRSKQRGEGVVVEHFVRCSCGEWSDKAKTPVAAEKKWIAHRDKVKRDRGGKTHPTPKRPARKPRKRRLAA